MLQYLILLSGKVIEIVTVHENWCRKLSFDVLRLVREFISGKFLFFFFYHMILIRMFFAVKTYINIFTIKIKRNHHSSETGRVSATD